jgi:hypothetical protein
MNKRHALFLVLALSSSVAAKPPADGAYSCDVEQPEYCMIGGTEVEIAGGKIQKASYWHHTCITYGRLGYGCLYEVDRGYLLHDPHNSQKWADKGLSTRVTVTATTSTSADTIALSIGKSGILLDFKDAGSVTSCGAATSLPKRVFMVYKSKRCRVVFHKY